METVKDNLSIDDIFKIINSSKLKYFHFKSNSNLHKSFSGKSDFDLIVNKTDSHKFEKLLLHIGFKRRVSTFDKFYFGVEDFLYYDSEAEKMHHFHIHYEIIFGEVYSENYSFSNFDYWFKNTFIHPEYPIRTLIPELEIILLTLRILLRSRYVPLLKNSIRNKISNNCILKKDIAKYQYLLDRRDETKFKKILTISFDNIKTNILEFNNLFTNDNINLFHFVRIRKSIIKDLRIYQRVDSTTAKKLKSIRRMSKKTSVSSLPNNGKIISLIGPDGAGKTTLSSDISIWLRYKLSSENIFLGQVKQSKINWTLRKISYCFKKIHLLQISSFFKDYTHIINAKYRKIAIDSCRVLSGTGFYIITDRYPFKEFWNMKIPMDGPKLHKNSLFYNHERNIYKSFPDYPNLIIILKVPLDVCIARKPDEHNTTKRISNIQKKIEAIEGLSEISNIHIVDGTQKYDAVRKQVRAIIWDNI